MKKLLGLKRASSIVDRFKKTRVLVIGDLIMDHFIWGKVKRISPEAPVPVVEVTSENLMLGGSANVVNNIHSLGGKSFLTGVVGADEDGKKLVGLLREKGIPVEGIITDDRRPTTIKTRIIAHSQQVVRFDRERKEKIDGDSTGKVLGYIRKAVKNADIVVISDYAKGLITEGLVEETREMCRRLNIPVAVDPKVEHFGYYRGATIVTPNNLEASQASGVDIADDESLHRAGEVLFNKLGCKALLITRGENGMSLFESDSETHIQTVAREVFDVSGAGDTVISVLALALGSGASFREAALLANYAAGVVVGKVGTATLTKGELIEAVSEGLKVESKKKQR
jgi:D-glycero-beta-D-manno-heptose-7-phosphate kinase